MKSKMLAKKLLAVLGIASLVFLVGCGGTTGQSINQPPAGVTVSPGSATVQTGGVQQFTATVSPSGANQAVTWSLSGTDCTGASCGTIDATGKYAAPATAPTPATVTLTATSVTDATKSASATITVTAPAPAPAPADLAKLTGPYAFLFNGGDSGGAVVIAGSFTADGSGNITGGLEDISRVSGVSTSVSFTGTYTVGAGANNLGSMTLTSTTPAVTSTFGFALGGFATGVATKGRFVAGAGAGAGGVGQLEKQDPAGFSAAAVSGPYVLAFEGVNDTGGRFVVAGRFDANGGGTLTNGQVDANSAGTLINKASMTGAYTVDSSGRGTAALAITGVINPVNVSFYVVSRKKLFAMQTDARSATVKDVLSGTIKEQSGGPFLVSSLSGNAVVALQGVSGTDTSVLVGQATANGAGSLDGVTDQNDAGVIVLNRTFSGTYTVDADGLGRGTLTITGDPKVKTIYFEQPNKVFIMDTNTGAQFGVAEAQAAGPFSNGSVSGNYFFGGLPSPVMSTFDIVIGGCGFLIANGAGSTSGGYCLNDFFGFNGTYSVAANGRATQTIENGFGSSPIIFYLISPSGLVAIEVTPGLSSGVTVIEK
jgi:Bacterial Ig-like domain (group 2)